MIKRKTIKPVKAWATLKNGALGPWRIFPTRDEARKRASLMGLVVVRVTVSGDAPATRLSAAQRRVVEAAKYCAYASKHYGKISKLMQAAVGALLERVEDLERAKGNRK
jgi:hypothetical protein